jgi:hypothetical protein
MPNNYYNFGTPFTPGTKVRSEQINTEYAGVESGFDLLPTDPTAGSTGTGWFGTETQGATVNDYLITTPDPQSALIDGQRVAFFATHTNDGPATFNVDGLGVVNAVDNDGTPLVADDIMTGQYYEFVYDNANTQFVRSLAGSDLQIGGADTQIQYNDGGVFGGTAGFTFNKGTLVTALPGDLTVVGNVDGRDVSADGATLDSHIGDGTIHYTQASISITASQISDFATAVAGIAVSSVSGGTNVNVTGTATDPIVNLDAAITGVSVNGVTLTTAGVATNFLDEQGNYTSPAGAMVGGADTNVQFNNAGVFGGSADFVWDGTNVTIDGRVELISATSQLPTIRFSATGQGVDEKNWDINLFDDELSIRALNDSWGGAISILTAGRGTGVFVDSLNIGSSDVDNIEFESVSSITFSSTTLTLASETRVENGQLYLEQSAAAGSDIATYGQLWVNQADDTLNYRTEAGVNFDLTAGGGGGNVSNTGTPLNNQLAVWTNATTIEGDANLTWDGSQLEVGGFMFVQSGAASLFIKDTDSLLAVATPTITFRDSADANMGVIGYSAGDGELKITNQNPGEDLVLNGGSGLGKVQLQKAGADVLRTVSAATGGVEVNNTSTGGGFERVLTTSDLGGGGTPGGADGQLQYNNAGAFGGDPFMSVDFTPSSGQSPTLILDATSGSYRNPVLQLNMDADDFALIDIREEGAVRGEIRYSASGTFTDEFRIENIVSPVNDDVTGVITLATRSGTSRQVRLIANRNGLEMQNGSFRIKSRVAADHPDAVTYGQIFHDSGDGDVKWRDSAGVEYSMTSNLGALSPGGADTNIQFNNAGAFGGEADLTWDQTTNIMEVGSVATPGTVRAPDGVASAGADFTIRAGDGAGTNQDGGVLLIRAGDGTGSGDDGRLDLQAGDFTGNAGEVRLLTAGTARLAIQPNGDWEVGGAAGNSGDVLTSQGAGSPPQWAAPAGGGVFTEDGQFNLYGGTGAGAALLGTALDNILVGNNAGNGITSGDENIAIGKNALSSIDTESNNLAIGTEAHASAVSAGSSIVIGNDGVKLGTNSFGISVGQNAIGLTSDSVFRNHVFGQFAAQNLATGGDDNVVIGYQTMQDATASFENVVIGNRAGVDARIWEQSVVIGREAGEFARDVANSILIGYGAGPSSPFPKDISEKLYIETNTAFADTPLIGGDFSTGLNGRYVDIHGSLFFEEKAVAVTPDRAGYGQLFVRNTTPNQLFWRNDAGTEINLSINATASPQGNQGDVQLNDGGGPPGFIADNKLNFDYFTNGVQPVLRVGDDTPVTGSSLTTLDLSGINGANHAFTFSHQGILVSQMTYAANQLLIQNFGEGGVPILNIQNGSVTQSFNNSTTAITLTGELRLDASGGPQAGNASLNIPTGVAPSPLEEGDIWKTGSQLFIHLNGSNTVLATGGQNNSSIVNDGEASMAAASTFDENGWVDNVQWFRVYFWDVDLGNASADLTLRLYDTGLVTTGYDSHCIDVDSAGTRGFNASTVNFRVNSGNASSQLRGFFQGQRLDETTDRWSVTGRFFDENNNDTFDVYGEVDLGSDIDGVRIQSVGAVNFDAGNYAIQYGF